MSPLCSAAVRNDKRGGCRDRQTRRGEATSGSLKRRLSRYLHAVPSQREPADGVAVEACLSAIGLSSERCFGQGFGAWNRDGCSAGRIKLPPIIRRPSRKALASAQATGRGCPAHIGRVSWAASSTAIAVFFRHGQGLVTSGAGMGRACLVGARSGGLPGSTRNDLS